MSGAQSNPGDNTLGLLLHQACREVRSLCKDPMASVVVLLPSKVNGILARREMAVAGGFIRVTFMTPAQLFDGLADPLIRQRGLRRDSAGFVSAVIAQTLSGITSEDDVPRYLKAVTHRGWLPTLSRSVSTLDDAGCSHEQLNTLESASADAKERAAAMSVLLEQVSSARQKANIASPRDMEDAAIGCLDGNAEGYVMARHFDGAVVLGDGRLPPLQWRVLQQFLSERPVVHVRLPYFSHLPAAPFGLRKALPQGCPQIELPPPKTKVEVFSTPDPVAEQHEVVRRIRRRIREGIPLDQIAVVLPDAANVTSLEDALRRAGIPAVFQVGASLKQSPPARFLVSLMKMARGGVSIRQWHDVLLQPGLRIAAQVNVEATRGKTSWRRLLSTCGATQGTQVILRALEASFNERREKDQVNLEACADPQEKQVMHESMQRRVQSHEALRACMLKLDSALPKMASADLATWATCYRDIIEGWWPNTPSRRQLIGALSPFTLAGELAMSRQDVETLFLGMLESTPRLSGSLTDRSVRVLSPMHLLGASFQEVIVTGLVQNTFPKSPSEDPILTDAFIEELSAGEPRFFSSKDRMALERRRFFAIRSAAKERLVCMVPRLEALKHKALLPSTLVLELLSEIQSPQQSATVSDADSMSESRCATFSDQKATAVSFADFEKHVSALGYRGATYAEDPADSIDLHEFRLSRLKGKSPAAQKQALEALSDHLYAKRNLAMLRAHHRLRSGESHPELRVHAGFVSPELLPCKGIDGEALTPWQMKTLLMEPMTFFERHTLEIFNLKELPEGFNPLDRRFIERQIHRSLQEAMDYQGPNVSEHLASAVSESFEKALDRAGINDASLLLHLRNLSAHRIAQVLAADAVVRPRLQHEGAIDSQLPFVVSLNGARVSGSQAQWLVDRLPGRADESYFEYSLQAMASNLALSSLSFVTVDGRGKSVDAEAATQSVIEASTRVHRCVTHGFFGGQSLRSIAMRTQTALESDTTTVARFGVEVTS